MLQPHRAPVEPRIILPDGGELPLEDKIAEYIEHRATGVVAILGAHGFGKTTALEHLAAVLPRDANVKLLDSEEAAATELEVLEQARLVVYAAGAPRAATRQRIHSLAPWNRDDFIEYLLARHRDRCTSVMSRIGPADLDAFTGIPELWAIILDQLADDPSISDARSALAAHLEKQLPDTDVVQRSRNACLSRLTASASNRDQEQPFPPPGFPPSLGRILRHPAVRMHLAAERIIADLHDGSKCDFLGCRLPRELIRAVARHLTPESRGTERLREFMAGDGWRHATTASILHAINFGWRPEGDNVRELAGAYLAGIVWPGAPLAQANLGEADLSAADLTSCNMEEARAGESKFSRSRLEGARMRKIIALEANFASAVMNAIEADGAFFDGANLTAADLEDAEVRGASFSGAKLNQTDFTNANLAGSLLVGAEIEEARFNGANLNGAQMTELKLRVAEWHGATFSRADLSRCDLEELNLGSSDFQSAKLQGALLTGTATLHANLEGANLRETGLGDIVWEHCNLRNADLNGATFHMGSSRSGKLITPIASEGTRTGFYTDDYDDKSFKNPEEIRKAALCGCDLRWAKIDKVDFYLVDLRGAQYDAEQEAHFKRCGAILGNYDE